MKILVVINYRPNQGGLSGAVEELAKSLKQEGFLVDFASTYGRVRERIKNIINIFQIAPHYDFIMGTGCAYYGFLPILVGVIAAKVYRKKALVDFHEGYPVPFMSRFGRVIKIFIKDFPVTVASGYLFDILKKYKFNIFLIPHHFHFEHFFKRSKPFVWNKKVMWMGSFEFMYDPETALKACELVLKVRKDIEFHFFGAGSSLNRLMKQYGQANVIFEGFIPRNELLERYQDYSIFLNTSFGDNFPLRLVEASFNELIVISARYGGTATIYNDKECLFFEKGDYKKLSEYILNIIDKPYLYDSFRENMHRKVMNFTWDKVRSQWLGLIT